MGPGSRWSWESGRNEWIRVEGRLCVGGSEHEAWVGPGQRPWVWGGACFEETREILEGYAGLGVTYRHGKRGGGDGGTWDPGMVLPQLLALAGLQVVRPCWQVAWSHPSHGHCGSSLRGEGEGWAISQDQ